MDGKITEDQYNSVFLYLNIGSLVGLLLITIGFDYFFVNMMKFVPVAALIILSIVHILIESVYLVFSPPFKGYVEAIILLIHGFFFMTILYYLVFFTPLHIAIENRISHEMTPSGTLISCNYVFGTYLSLLFVN